MKLLKRLRRSVLAVSPEETKASRRGFHPGDPSALKHLERIGAQFLAGYHAGLEESSAGVLSARLNETIDRAFLGFAFEGAGMALTLTDHLRLTRKGFADLLCTADEHRYMVHVGAGWAWARLPWIRGRLDRALSRLDPVVGWLAVDGYGFHEGYFHTDRTVRNQLVPAGVRGYARRAFDQGVGRSLWFVGGANPEIIARDILLFAAPRRADLWSGVGLACSYAGGVSADAIQRLWELAETNRASVGLGCAFGCEARRRAGNLVPCADLAARLVCNLGAEQAAAIAREEEEAAVESASAPGYEIWRQRTQSRVASVMAITRSREVTA